MARQHIILVGEPRSGTTILWKTFRQDKRLASYCEPFNLRLRCQFDGPKDVLPEFYRDYDGQEDLLRRHWSPILPYEELYDTLLTPRVNYLQKLLATHSNCIVKTVSCSAKISSLRRHFDDAVIVHLVRDPRAWTTSHLRPKGSWLQGLPDDFFCYEGGFNYWSRERIARYAGIDGYAHEQLLQLWNYSVAKGQIGSPHLTVRFEDFALDPESVLKQVYALLDIEYRPLDVNRVHPPNPPHEPGNSQWGEALKKHLHSELELFVFPYNRVNHNALATESSDQ